MRNVLGFVARMLFTVHALVLTWSFAASEAFAADPIYPTLKIINADTQEQLGSVGNNGTFNLTFDPTKPFAVAVIATAPIPVAEVFFTVRGGTFSMDLLDQKETFTFPADLGTPGARSFVPKIDTTYTITAYVRKKNASGQMEVVGGSQILLGVNPDPFYARDNSNIRMDQLTIFDWTTRFQIGVAQDNRPGWIAVNPLLRTPIALRVDPSSVLESIIAVEFYIDGVLFSEQEEAPYLAPGNFGRTDVVPWIPTLGEHIVTVIATGRHTDGRLRRTLPFRTTVVFFDPAAQVTPEPKVTPKLVTPTPTPTLQPGTKCRRRRRPAGRASRLANRANGGVVCVKPTPTPTPTPTPYSGPSHPVPNATPKWRSSFEVPFKFSSAGSGNEWSNYNNGYNATLPRRTNRAEVWGVCDPSLLSGRFGLIDLVVPDRSAVFCSEIYGPGKDITGRKRPCTQSGVDCRHHAYPGLWTDVKAPYMNRFWVYVGDIDLNKLANTDWLQLGSWGGNLGKDGTGEWRGMMLVMKGKKGTLEFGGTNPPKQKIAVGGAKSMPLNQWVRFDVYIDYIGTGHTVVWMNGVKTLEGFDIAQPWVKKGYVTREHWGLHANPEVKEGIQFNDDIQVWMLGQPLTNFDAPPESPFSN